MSTRQYALIVNHWVTTDGKHCHRYLRTSAILSPDGFPRSHCWLVSDPGIDDARVASAASRDMAKCDSLERCAHSLCHGLAIAEALAQRDSTNTVWRVVLANACLRFGQVEQSPEIRDVLLKRRASTVTMLREQGPLSPQAASQMSAKVDQVSPQIKN